MLSRIVKFGKKHWLTCAIFLYYTLIMHYGIYLHNNYFVLVFSKEEDRGAFRYFAYFLIVMTDFYFYFNTLFLDNKQTDISKYLQIGEYSRSGLPNEIVNIDLKQYSKSCQFCKNKPLKHDRSSHCPTCGYCVLRRDHHCKWMGKCVGVNNTDMFISQMIWNLIIIIYLISFFIIFLIKCPDLRQEYEFLNFSYPQYVLFLSLIVLGIFFILKSGDQLANELIFIYNDVTFYDINKLSRPIEMYNPILEYDQTAYDFNPKNKNYIFSYYYLFGASFLLRLFFPIPKMDKFDIVENNPIFCDSKRHHPIEETMYRINVQKHNFDEIMSATERENDPNIFLEKSLENYRDRIIV